MSELNTTAPHEGMEHEVMPMPELQSGMKVNVLRDNNDYLFTGLLEVLSSDIIRLSMPKGERLPPVEADTPIKIRGVQVSADTFTLHGKIAGRRETYWVVDCLTTLQTKASRLHFRQRVIADAKFAVVGDTYDTENGLNDESLEFHDCQIIDVSLGGVHMSTAEPCHEGSRLFFKDVVLHSQMAPFALPCRVVRTWTEDGVTQYGCQLEPIAIRERARMLQAMFLIQKEEVRRSHEQ